MGFLASASSSSLVSLGCATGGSPLTTEVQPRLTLLGTREDWSFGQTFGPQTGWALTSWTSGPVLPVEPWNMAMEAPEGEGSGEGHGAAKPHGSGH